MRKGVSRTVSTGIFAAITLAAGGTLYTSVDSGQEAFGGGEQEILDDPEKVEVDSTWRSGGRYMASISNSGEVPANLTFAQGGEVIANATVGAGEAEEVDLGCVSRSQRVEIYSSKFEDARSLDVEPRYCIEITDTYVEGKLSPERVWEARAFRNNFEEDPYANKDVRITIDGEEEVMETDSEGRFSFRARWDLNYIPEGGKWSRTIEYTRSANTVDFHRGTGKFQPPNRIRLDYEDGSSQVSQTQEGFKQTPSDDISMKYDIVPTGVSDSSVELKVNVRVKAKDGLAQDWSNRKDTSDLIYQMPIPSGGSYPNVESLECASGPDVSCQTGDMFQRLDSSTDGKEFTKAELPEKNGEKYVPVEMNVTTQDQPFLGSLTSFSYYRYDGDWKRFYVDEKEIYVPSDTEMEFEKDVKPSDADSNIESRFGDADATGERNYRQRYGLTSTIGGWWNAPVLSRANAYYSVNSELDYSGSSGEDSLPAVTYEWGDVSSGETYDLNYTVQLDRADADRTFMLPVNLGTFGTFPDGGGKASEIYNSGGVRYPPYGQTGSYSFATEIPAQGSSDAMVYKITLPAGEDRWQAKTYVLNTGEERIENIYLLNSQGEFQEFEGGSIDPGQTISETLNLEPNDGEKVQLNMQFQTINRGTTEPEYSDWPYDASLSVSGDQSYSFDISDKVYCNTRYCSSYRTGNRDEAKRIDNLRGNSATQALFEEEIDSVTFSMTNDDPDAGSQWIKNLGIWVWYLQPFEDNIESALTRPDKIKIETLEGDDDLAQGTWVKNF